MSARSDMDLPEGVTCDTCYAFSFCRGIGVAKEGQNNCDWFPVRYTPQKQYWPKTPTAPETVLRGSPKPEPKTRVHIW